MRKVFLSILLLTSLFIKAQQAPPGFVPNYANTAFRALSGYGLFGMPQDTFAIPTADRMVRWSAYHGDTTYIWSVLQQKWIISSGGTPTLSVLTIASPLTGGSYNGLAPISIGVDTNIIHTSAYNDGRYSTGIGTTIYTGDGSLPTNRTIDLNGHNLEFQQSGVDWFSMIPGNFTTQIRATDGTGTTYLVLNADVSDPTVKFELYSDNGTNEVSILGNATTDNIIYTADIHTFNFGSGTSQFTLSGVDEQLHFTSNGGRFFDIGDDLGGYRLGAGTGGVATYTADTHTFNGETIRMGISSTYPSGLDNLLSSASGLKSIGDWDNNVNGTRIDINDVSKTIGYKAVDHNFSGRVKVDSLSSALHQPTVTGHSKMVIADENGQLTTTTRTINQNDTIGNYTNIKTVVTGNLQIADQGQNSTSNYPAFVYPIVKGDTLLYFYKASTTHAGEGKFMISRSIDGNRSIDTTWQVGLAPIDSVTNFAIGITRTGRILAAIKNTFTGNSEIYAKSDDGGRTWDTTGRYSYLGTATTPFGRMKYFDGDTLVTQHYTGGAADSVILNYTANNGASFSLYSLLAGDGVSLYLESDFCYLGNRRAIAIVRTENTTRPSQFTSTDNGHTWTRKGGLNAILFESQMSPLFIEKYDGRLWLLGSDREGTGDFSNLFYSTGSEAQVFSDTSKWSKKSLYYYPLSDDAGSLLDFGYNVPFQFAGRLFTASYDVTATQGSSGTRKTRIFVSPIINNGNFAKVYSIVNQSIPNATATAITFSKVDLNDGRLFDTDSGFVIIRRDGWYQIDAVATYAVSAAGSYRQMYIYLTSASYTALAPHQPQIISQTTIAGNATNSDFDRMECHTVYWLRAGEQIKVFTKQDSGAALNIVNTAYNSMTTLNIKYIPQL